MSELKVIGAGFGRTGTKSLQEALIQLGFDPCYHMVEVFKNPGHNQMWIDAGDGIFDWDKLFGDYQSAVDFPACAFYKELFDHTNQQAKVILTVRDFDRWYTSVIETIYTGEARRLSTNPIVRFYAWLNKHFFFRFMEKHSHMCSKVIWDRHFPGPLIGPNGKENARAGWDKWIAQVKKDIPADKLLIFEAKEGWYDSSNDEHFFDTTLREPLCKFLEVDVPEGDYPRVNDSAQFKSRMGQLRVMMYAIPTVVIGSLAAGAYVGYKHFSAQ